MKQIDLPSLKMFYSDVFVRVKRLRHLRFWLWTCFLPIALGLFFQLSNCFIIAYMTLVPFTSDNISFAFPLGPNLVSMPTLPRKSSVRCSQLSFLSGSHISDPCNVPLIWVTLDCGVTSLGTFTFFWSDPALLSCECPWVPKAFARNLGWVHLKDEFLLVQGESHLPWLLVFL